MKDKEQKHININDWNYYKIVGQLTKVKKSSISIQIKEGQSPLRSQDVSLDELRLIENDKDKGQICVFSIISN